MIKGGIGGSKTLTGLEFEKRVDLREVFGKLKDYSVKGNELLYNGKMVAKLFKKNELYNKFLKELKVDWSGKLSKKMLPDETIFVLSNKTLFIIEMKFQKVAGSVDEKLQTCDFKKKQYQKLLSGTDIKVEYCYILSDWFMHPSYKDTLNYVLSVDCKYFFETLPFEFLGLPQPE
ncbi:MAG: hypothetical protein Q7S33_03495 [Nanoarchaeota archaeon]|nr:hypothetical protein [Nanoarchaeota archaeon]